MLYEKRLVARLTQYWDGLRKDSSIPEFSHYNDSAIDEVKDYLFVLHIIPQQGEGMNCRVDSMGEGLRGIIGQDLSDQVVNPRTKSPPALKLIARCAEVKETRAIVMDEGQFVSDNHKIIKYRSCLLPFCTGSEVTHIVAGISWKEF